MAGSGPSETCFSKTSAGSFDGLWSTPAIGFQGAKSFDVAVRILVFSSAR